MSDDLKADLGTALRGVTKEWKKAKRREDRISAQPLSRMRASSYRVTIRDAAFEVMEEAYNHASSNGLYYATARQIMYAARPLVLEMTDGNCWSNSAYFTQTLLKDYMEAFDPDWNVVWDARGHLHEPHTGASLGLGGVDVEEYLEAWTDNSFETKPVMSISTQVKTKGPALRYGAALFIEKEGFSEVLQAAGIAGRYDLAIFSSKGLPVKAACDIATALHNADIPILVAHDFDLAGFKIVKTMEGGVRLTYGTPVIDIGLRLEDVDGLESEPVRYRQRIDPREYLEQCGATEEEQAFLVEGGGWRRGWHGQRVELNAMTSEQFISWLEGKLEVHEIEKVIPEESILAEAYKRAVFRRELAKRAKAYAKEMADVTVPEGLIHMVAGYLLDNAAESWDEAIAAIVEIKEGDKSEEAT